MSLSVKGVVASHPKNVLQNNNNIKNMTNTDNNDILITNSARKKPQPRLNNSKDSKSNPQQVAVARRNARERNRVKQVNNGFANLRERIPNFIASTFESGRGGSKKLSKVETLRMAVEYIRSLEDLLNLDSSTTNYSSSPTKSPTDSCQNISYNYGDMSPSLDDEDDLMSSHSSPPPQQYVRINTSNNTYQIIPANLYDIDNSENMEPHILTSEASLVTNDIDFRSMHLSQHELSLISNNEYCRDSLSPEMYSDHSFSPSNTLVVNRMDQKCFIAATGDYNASMNIIVKEELDSDLPVISLKTENDLPDNHKGVIDVMHWWESQPQQMERS